MGRKGDHTREYIKETAYALFVQKGYKDVTMKDVCEETGLSRGGLYRHFGSTAELFEEIWRELVDDSARGLEESILRGESATVILRELLEKRRKKMEDGERALSLSIYEYCHAVNSRLFCELNSQSKEMWQRLIRYGVQRGEFLRVDTEAVVDLILYSYQGVRMWSRILPVDQGVSRHITDCIWKILVGEEKGES